jgi:ubiquitin-protein ligase E3 C
MPEGHWLMTDYFDMRGFIPAVVSEEAYKHQNQDAEEDDDDIMEIDSDTGDSDEEALVGTHRTQQVRRIERLKRQQRKTARRKQLGAVTPRLEILQNMPFFIPFATRVEIFHQFVHLDQFQRRDGFVDPELWRLRMMRSARTNAPSREEIGKHSAQIRRDHCFEDAFDQFYDLGESLKEPIQISFVDSFGTEEAGIDGGGVTKEFLTSITSEAFTPSPGSSGNLFAENDQHLLYPNPAAMDERRAYLKHLNFVEGKLEWNEAIRDLLKHYEFLGRIVGKCLYEGILIDVQFAPFFLVKWALSGGSNGAATNESGYRASVNDLRDLDEELYQGLVSFRA